MYVIYYFLDENKNPFYVGVTNNFKKRINQHLRKMRNGSKLPKYYKLKKVLNLGIKILDVIVIQEDDFANRKKANKREIELIDILPKKGYKLYNLTKGGDGGRTMTAEGYAEMGRKLKGRNLSEETKRKMSKVRKGKRLSPEQLKKRIGKKRSQSTRKKMSEARIGMKFSDEHKVNLSKARKKRVISDETRRKTSKTSKGKINIKKYLLTDPDGNTYITESGLVSFCEEHNLISSNLHKVLRGDRKHHKGWKIERIENDN